MTKSDKLAKHLRSTLSKALVSISAHLDEITVECEAASVRSVLYELRDNPVFAFEQLVDLCVVDYLEYGKYDWETEAATEKGFSRAVEVTDLEGSDQPIGNSRFAVVYHLLSTSCNHRLRLKVFVDDTHLVVPSIHDIWKGANWFEREAYDLFGVLFDGHPDLRRILTDYGFIGHPFRKDFPLSGHVEMRYDANLQQVIYEPVDIEPRILVPKVIRDDNRYLAAQGAEEVKK